MTRAGKSDINLPKKKSHKFYQIEGAKASKMHKKNHFERVNSVGPATFLNLSFLAKKFHMILRKKN